MQRLDALSLYLINAKLATFDRSLQLATRRNSF